MGIQEKVGDIMVKIPLSTGQINSLLKWRDSHKELVQPYEKNAGKEKDKRNKVLKIWEV